MDDAWNGFLVFDAQGYDVSIGTLSHERIVDQEFGPVAPEKLLEVFLGFPAEFHLSSPRVGQFRVGRVFDLSPLVERVVDPLMESQRKGTIPEQLEQSSRRISIECLSGRRCEAQVIANDKEFVRTQGGARVFQEEESRSGIGKLEAQPEACVTESVCLLDLNLKPSDAVEVKSRTEVQDRGSSLRSAGRSGDHLQNLAILEQIESFGIHVDPRRKTYFSQ